MRRNVCRPAGDFSSISHAHLAHEGRLFMRLQHLHLPHPIAYAHSLRLQHALLEQHLADKKALRLDPSLTSVAPPPTLLTFQTHPTYTVGRRHLKNNPLSPFQIAFLKGTTPRDPTKTQDGTSLATFHPSPRGGLLTYHAPGQLTAYLVCNLRTHNLTPRCYISMLENAVMRTCADQGVPNVMTTNDPGVWIAERLTSEAQEQREIIGSPAGTSVRINGLLPTSRKICAIGVQVSSGITSHGIGLNVFDSPIPENLNNEQLYTLPKASTYASTLEAEHKDLLGLTTPADSTVPAPGYLSWGFSRIVACGLEGKSVTWLSREQQLPQQDRRGPENQAGQSGKDLTLESVAHSLANEIARSLNIEEADIDRVTEDDVEKGT